MVAATGIETRRSVTTVHLPTCGTVAEVLATLPPPCAFWKHVTGDAVKEGQMISTVL